jgi:hypothetical protein
MYMHNYAYSWSFTICIVWVFILLFSFVHTVICFWFWCICCIYLNQPHTKKKHQASSLIASTVHRNRVAMVTPCAWAHAHSGIWRSHGRC